MKKVSLIAPLSLGLAAIMPLNAAAETEFGYTPWFSSVSGTVSDQGREISLREELKLNSSTSHGFIVDEGGWLRLNYTPVDYSAQGQVTSETQFGGSVYPVSADLLTDADLTDMGLRLLWHPGEQTDFGLGVTVKVIDADIRVTNMDSGGDGGLLGGLLGGGGDDEPSTERETVSEVFPMLSLAYSNPLTDLFSVGGEASYITYEDDEVLEFAAHIEFRGEAVGLRLGWQEKRYDISDNGFTLDARFNGAYAQLSVYL
ncbi:MAG: hypothetical protein EVA65_08010 [Oceanococcus sp.]|nr:MAG: hypothetical protein EVA65_08010 [Oceanococcus sp.]